MLNGTTIIARENDPVDLDGNGEFDDGFYIRTFRDDRVAMSNDAVYCIVLLRDASEALCPLDTPNTDRGNALIKIPLPGGNPVTPGDVNCDGQINGKDIQAFVVAVTTPGAYAAAYPGCNILNADTNSNTTADAGDIPSFLALLVP